MHAWLCSWYVVNFHMVYFIYHHQVESGHTGLHLAAIEGSKEVAGILLELKAALSVKDLHGCTSLHLAASYGNYEVAKMILAVPGHSSVHTSTKVLCQPCLNKFHRFR